MEKTSAMHHEIPTDLSGDAVVEISGELRRLLADVFAIYVKTKNFHWQKTLSSAGVSNDFRETAAP